MCVIFIAIYYAMRVILSYNFYIKPKITFCCKSLHCAGGVLTYRDSLRYVSVMLSGMYYVKYVTLSEAYYVCVILSETYIQCMCNA